MLIDQTATIYKLLAKELINIQQEMSFMTKFKLKVDNINNIILRLPTKELIPNRIFFTEVR